MRPSRLAIGMAGLALASMMSVPAALLEPASGPAHGTRKNKPSGSKPVAGGGERERVRRITRQVRQWMFQHPDPGGVTREQVIDHINHSYPDLPWHLQDAVLEASI